MKATEAPALIRQERRLRLGLSQARFALRTRRCFWESGLGGLGGLGGEDSGWLWLVDVGG